MAPFIEIVIDEPGFLRLTRVGNWYNILHLDTGEAEWIHGTETEVAERFHIVRKAKLPRSAPVPISPRVA